MRENIEHALSGYKEDQLLPDQERAYSEKTRRFQIKNFCDKPTELKIQSYSIEQEVPRMAIDARRQIQSNYSIESIKRVVTKALQLVAQNKKQKELFTEKKVKLEIKVKSEICKKYFRLNAQYSNSTKTES